MAEGEHEEGGGKRRAGGKKLMFMIGALLLLLIGGGGAVYFSGILQVLVGKPDTEKKAEAPPPPPKQPVPFDMADQLVNLNTTGRKATIMKISVTLELADGADTDKVKAIQDRIIDSFQTYMRELRPDDLRGSGGLNRLREELLGRVNTVVAPIKIDDVLFRELLVQ